MNPKVRVIVAFMKANLHRPLTLKEISELVGLSHSRVESLFKAELGKSVMQFRKELRLEKGRERLEDLSLNVKQIRLEIGYRDHSQFFRDFKKQFGMTPTQYRERHIAAAPRSDEKAQEKS